MTQYTNPSCPEFVKASACRKPEPYSGIPEEELFALFDELDALILDLLPQSLSVPPSQLIARIIYQRIGISLTAAEIIDAYLRYEKSLGESLFDGGSGYE